MIIYWISIKSIHAWSPVAAIGTLSLHYHGFLWVAQRNSTVLVIWCYLNTLACMMQIFTVTSKAFQHPELYKEFINVEYVLVQCDKKENSVICMFWSLFTNWVGFLFSQSCHFISSLPHFSLSLGMRWVVHGKSINVFALLICVRIKWSAGRIPPID